MTDTTPDVRRQLDEAIRYGNSCDAVIATLRAQLAELGYHALGAAPASPSALSREPDDYDGPNAAHWIAIGQLPDRRKTPPACTADLHIVGRSGRCPCGRYPNPDPHALP